MLWAVSQTRSPEPVRAVALVSGGLDSTLAVKVVQEQGILVIGITFEGAYCPRPLEGESNAEKAARQLDIDLAALPIDQGFIELVKAPRYGHGRNINPCIDCHILMVERAWAWGREHGARFVITGEVLGQRPMSQNKQGLLLVAKRSGAGPSLLRPLSARLLEPTEPEVSGLVDRERLLDIQGRSRHRQMELAALHGIEEYPTPAGGCLLTDAGFALRVREAFAHGEDTVSVIELLGLGRHFRLPSGARLVVGRNRIENDALLARAPEGASVVDATRLPGPVGLVIPGGRDLELAASICARYSDRRGEPGVTVIAGGRELVVRPARPEESARLLVG